jgi:hypothetical protein
VLITNVFGAALAWSRAARFMVSPSDRAGREGSRVAIGRTRGGRYLRGIYVPDGDLASVFVITAYELTGKPLIAYRRRRRRKGRR